MADPVEAVLLLSTGLLVLVATYRLAPYFIRALFSDEKKHLRVSLSEDERKGDRRWRPIVDAADLLGFTESAYPIESSRVRPLRLRPSGSTQKLLVCHDMAGNYHETDAAVDGYYAATRREADWTIGFRLGERLLDIDVFVYFSHNLVSVPPSGWISACHACGALCYGTLLTEWDQGRLELERLLATPETSVDRLLRIQRAHNFDGYLVNVECVVRAPERLRLFVQALAASTRVLWYDSVLYETGELRWQNGLNELNEAFFKVANDGIFTNYSWREAKVRVSLETAGSTRRADVWHGIDVWGRGTLGDGGMACDVAMNYLYSVDPRASIALFAPGWTLESCAERDEVKHLEASERFWNNIAAARASSRKDARKGFALLEKKDGWEWTDFCDGGGRNLFIQGEARIENGAWLDLRRSQSVYPARRAPEDVYDDARGFSGSRSLRLRVRPGETRALLTSSSGFVCAENDAVELHLAFFSPSGEELEFEPTFRFGKLPVSQHHRGKGKRHANDWITRRHAWRLGEASELVGFHVVRKARERDSSELAGSHVGSEARERDSSDFVWIGWMAWRVVSSAGGSTTIPGSMLAPVYRRSTRRLTWSCSRHASETRCACFPMTHVFRRDAEVERDAFLQTVFGRDEGVLSAACEIEESARLSLWVVGEDGLIRHVVESVEIIE